jgi:hypothetical protein
LPQIWRRQLLQRFGGKKRAVKLDGVREVVNGHVHVQAYEAILAALMSYMTENCCQGDATACGIGVCDPQPASQGKRHEAFIVK